MIVRVDELRSGFWDKEISRMLKQITQDHKEESYIEIGIIIKKRTMVE